MNPRLILKLLPEIIEGARTSISSKEDRVKRKQLLENSIGEIV
jgi:hypothetical protein